jgi:hypothetical protein
VRGEPRLERGGVGGFALAVEACEDGEGAGEDSDVGDGDGEHQPVYDVEGPHCGGCVGRAAACCRGRSLVGWVALASIFCEGAWMSSENYFATTIDVEYLASSMFGKCPEVSRYHDQGRRRVILPPSSINHPCNHQSLRATTLPPALTYITDYRLPTLTSPSNPPVFHAKAVIFELTQLITTADSSAPP